MSELAKDLLDAEKLVDFGLAREEGVTVCDLAHDAADSPDIDFLAIVVTQEKFGCSIPPGRNIVRKLRSWLVQLSREAKITYF